MSTDRPGPAAAARAQLAEQSDLLRFRDQLGFHIGDDTRADTAMVLLGGFSTHGYLLVGWLADHPLMLLDCLGFPHRVADGWVAAHVGNADDLARLVPVMCEACTSVQVVDLEMVADDIAGRR
ncbi:MAG: hypothetical protein H6983_26530 [Ectothiorhodospiraceae bacterium]|nr:hypothetical protein [Ectothiorhodospiraceae bacterium]